MTTGSTTLKWDCPETSELDGDVSGVHACMMHVVF